MNRPLTALFAALEALLVVGIGIGIPLVPLTILWAAQYGLQIVQLFVEQVRRQPSIARDDVSGAVLELELEAAAHAKATMIAPRTPHVSSARSRSTGGFSDCHSSGRRSSPRSTISV